MPWLAGLAGGGAGGAAGAGAGAGAAGMTAAEGASAAVPLAGSGAAGGGGLFGGLGSTFGTGGSMNNFLRGVTQGYTGMPVGTQGFGWNATTLGEAMPKLFGGGGQPAQAQSVPMRQHSLQDIMRLMQQIQPYNVGGGGLF